MTMKIQNDTDRAKGRPPFADVIPERKTACKVIAKKAMVKNLKKNPNETNAIYEY